MSEQVLEGLKKLNPENDNHWTMDGQAKLDTVKFLSGVAVTRDELEKIAPGFNRQAMKEYAASLKVEVPNATPPEPVRDAGDETGIVTEQPKMEDRSPTRETQIESLAAQITSTDEAILEVKRVQEEARIELIRLETISEKLRDRMIVVNPPTTHQENIKNYLASVNAARQGRATARMALANSGIDIDGLQAMAAPAPIDRMLKTRRR